MWTVMPSPIGDLRIVERDGSIVAIEFSPFQPLGRRASARRALRRRAGAGRGGAPADGLLRPRADRLRPAARARSAPTSSSACGSSSGPSATARPRPTARSRGRLGMTNAASRAVGLANGRNPIPIVVPCHRVIGANGTLTGYAGGLERKQQLLELEQAPCSERCPLGYSAAARRSDSDSRSAAASTAGACIRPGWRESRSSGPGDGDGRDDLAAGGADRARRPTPRPARARRPTATSRDAGCRRGRWRRRRSSGGRGASARGPPRPAGSGLRSRRSW